MNFIKMIPNLADIDKQFLSAIFLNSFINSSGNLELKILLDILNVHP